LQVRRRDQAEHAGDREGDEGRGQHATDAPGPEADQVDALAVAPLGEQAGHGQEPGQGEQGRHAEVAALGPSQAGVEQEHRDDGHALEPVDGGEGREVATGATAGRAARRLGRVGWELELEVVRRHRIGTGQRLDVGQGERRAG